MLEAAFWGFLTAGSLWVGAAIAIAARPGERLIGLAIAFGSGALMAAVAYELVLEAFETSLRFAAAGFAVGAIAFYVGDSIVDRRGGHGRKGMKQGDELAGAANAIVLGTVLDGIPESFVLGSALKADGAVPLAVVVSVFASNIPEALSATSGFLHGGLTRTHALMIWSKVVVVSVAAAALGWWALDAMAVEGGAFALAFAGGAVLVMLSDTLMPEALKLGGREAGLLTALGFALGFALS